MTGRWSSVSTLSWKVRIFFASGNRFALGAHVCRSLIELPAQLRHLEKQRPACDNSEGDRHAGTGGKGGKHPGTPGVRRGGTRRRSAIQQAAIARIVKACDESLCDLQLLETLVAAEEMFFESLPLFSGELVPNVPLDDLLPLDVLMHHI